MAQRTRPLSQSEACEKATLAEISRSADKGEIPDDGVLQTLYVFNWSKAKPVFIAKTGPVSALPLQPTLTQTGAAR